MLILSTFRIFPVIFLISLNVLSFPIDLFVVFKKILAGVNGLLVFCGDILAFFEGILAFSVFRALRTQEIAMRIEKSTILKDGRFQKY